MTSVLVHHAQMRPKLSWELLRSKRVTFQLGYNYYDSAEVTSVWQMFNLEKDFSFLNDWKVKFRIEFDTVAFGLLLKDALNTWIIA